MSNNGTPFDAVLVTIRTAMSRPPVCFWTVRWRESEHARHAYLTALGKSHERGGRKRTPRVISDQ